MRCRVPAVTCATITFALLLLFSGCGDDDAGRPPLTLDDVWPHAVGSAWTYDVATTSVVDSTLVLPTVLPSLESLHADLVRAAQAAAAGTVAYSFTFTLQDTITASDGLPALAILGASVWDVPDSLDPGSGVVGVVPLLLGSTGSSFAVRDSALLRFNKDVDGPTWVYLTGPVETGTGFAYGWPASAIGPRHLQARIWSIRDASFAGTFYRDLVECLYLYDMGETVDGEGDTYRQYVGARMWFAPGVGPVAWQERIVFGARTAYGGGAHVRLDSWAVLTAAH